MTDYLWWGGRLCSELPLPELLPWPGPDLPPWVTIRLGPVEAELPGECWHDHHARLAADGRFLVDDPGIARFLGLDGDTVVIDLACDPADRGRLAVLRAILYGTVLGGLCLQRGLMPLHATTVVMGGRGLILLGPRGSGKSSLAATLFRRGYPVLADDLSALDCEPGRCRVLPGFPGLRLTHGLADRLALPCSAETARDGARLMLSPLAPAWPRPVRPQAAIHLTVDDQVREPELTVLPPLAAVGRLHRNIFRPGLAAAMGRSPQLLAAAVQAARDIPRHLLLRTPPGLGHLDALADLALAGCCG